MPDSFDIRAVATAGDLDAVAALFDGYAGSPPSMGSALAFYERLGFERIDPCYAPTPPGTVFKAKAL